MMLSLTLLRCGALLLLFPLMAVAQANQHMTLDLSAKPTTSFLGLGVEFDPYTWPVDPKRWASMMEHLVYMHPGFLRVMSAATDYCSGFDSSGIPQYRWKTNPDDPKLRPILAVLDFAQQHGIEVYLGEWSPPGVLGIHSPGDPRWARIVADFVAYLIHERHYTVIHHYILMNEPNGSWMWPGSTPDFAEWSIGIRQLRANLDRNTLQALLLAGPDNSGDENWFRHSVADLHKEFGAWELHVYAKDEQVNSGLLEIQLKKDTEIITELDPEGKDKPHFVAESGMETGKIEDLDQQPRVHDFDYGELMSDYVVQVARAGWAGADAWDLDDAMHDNGRGGKKVWGFLDSSSDAGMQLRPWYYAWALLSRSLPKGSAILPLQGDTVDPVRGTAAVWTENGKQQWSVILVNHTDAPATVLLSLPQTTKELEMYRYFLSEHTVNQRWEPAPSTILKQPSSVLSLKFPSRGVITLLAVPPGPH
jgi:hypothetical protein